MSNFSELPWMRNGQKRGMEVIFPIPLSSVSPEQEGGREGIKKKRRKKKITSLFHSSEYHRRKGDRTHLHYLYLILPSLGRGKRGEGRKKKGPPILPLMKTLPPFFPFRI